jgi:hypothetical protein
MIDLQTASITDTIYGDVLLQNHGTEILTISDAHTAEGIFGIMDEFPVRIKPMNAAIIRVFAYSEETGNITDTLIIESDDPKHPRWTLPVQVEYLPYHRILDNADPDAYSESGEWAFSVAQAYGENSRYAYLNKNDHPQATFSCVLSKSGFYDIWEIVLKTENAAHLAWYEIGVENTFFDSIQIDQNVGSGDWVHIGRYHLPSDLPVQVRVSHNNDPESGSVLRADAVKLILAEETTGLNAEENGIPRDYELGQNFPNPFNPTTVIPVFMSQPGRLEVSVYDLSGRLVARLHEGMAGKGRHYLEWDGQTLSGSRASSGVYIYRCISGEYRSARKMVKVK